MSRLKDINSLQKRILGHSRSKYLLIISNWVLQGIWYVDRTERIFKIISDLLLMLIFFVILINYINFIWSILLAIFIAHTLNWFFNHHFWALILEVTQFGDNSPQKISEYAQKLSDRASKKPSIIVVAIYGSYCRGELTNKSDLDIRLVRKTGWKNGLEACTFLIMENIRAFIKIFPLDIHLLDNSHHLFDYLKLREDEKPIVLYDSENLFNNKD